MLFNKYIVGQFKHPTGKLGRLAGWIMANRKSNINRNDFTVDKLNIKPDDHVLEIGCGPGIGLGKVIRYIGSGKVVGIDHSIEMIEQAGKRCSIAVSEGKLELWNDRFETCEFGEQFFDKVYCVNVIQFFKDQKSIIEKIYRILTPFGIAAITYMPRTNRPSRKQALEMAETVSKLMNDAGFSDVKILEYDISPVPSVTIIGMKLGQLQEEK